MIGLAIAGIISYEAVKRTKVIEKIKEQIKDTNYKNQRFIKDECIDIY